jgi:surface protein
MFKFCRKLVDLDVTNFNTKNSKSFKEMFYIMDILEKIDISKFNTSKCENINSMFRECFKLTEIDMFNWDMSDLNYNYGKENL